jgi:hypothetical protein
LLEISEDGRQFRSVFEIPTGGTSQNTYTFPQVTAKYFRITFLVPPSPPMDPALATLFGRNTAGQSAPDPGINIAELVLHPVARVNRFEDKAGFTAPDCITWQHHRSQPEMQ